MIAVTFSLRNEFLRVEIAPQTGYLRRVFDKLNSRGVLDPSEEDNVLVAIEDQGDSEGRFEKGNDVLARPKGRARRIASAPVIELVFPWTLSSACEADLLEEEIGEVELEGNALKFPVGAYEIKTAKLRI